MASEPRRRTVLILFVTMFPQTAASMVCMAPPVMAKEVAEGLGLPAQIAGAYIGLLYVFVIATSANSAYLISRVGPLRTSIGCVVASGAGLMLFGLGGIGAALLATVILGLSYGPLTPASSHVLAGHRTTALAFIVSVRQTSVPLGGVLAGLIVPPLVLATGWEHASIVLGAATALMGAAVGLSTPLIRREQAPRFATAGNNLLGALRFVVRRPRVLALAGVSFVYGATQVILSSFLVIDLTTVVGLDLITAGALLGASQVAGVLGRLAWGYAADHLMRPRRVLLLVGALIALASTLTGLFSGGWPLVLIIAVVALFGATASGWNGVFLAEIMREVEPSQVGLVTGGSLVFTYGGVIVGPPVFGVIAAFAGFSRAFLAMAIVVVVAAALTLTDDLGWRKSRVC